MVFPLPVNAVEHYMLAEDSVEYPRWFSLVLHLNGPLEERRLGEAIEIATKRHPLLRAILEYEGDRPARWIECRTPQYPIDWHGGPSSSAAHCERVVPPSDLRNQPGLRFRGRHDEEGVTLGIEFHHACVDGLGALQFVEDLLAVYGSGDGRHEWQLPPLDLHRLSSRDRCGLAGWRRALWWLYGSAGWLGTIEFLSHRPAPLGTLPALSASMQARSSGFCWRTLTRGQTSAVIRAAKEERVTVNDLVLRDTFVSLQEFVERHFPDRARDHKRIMVPVSLRGAGDERLPAANVVAMINLDRRPQRWLDRRRMLKVLHWELAAVKRLRLGLIFVQVLHALQALFGSLQRFLPTDRCQATCVVSNLGIVFPAFGPETIRRVEFYPPIRPLTSASFGLATHDGRMTVSLHYDAANLTADQGAELLDRLTRRLQACHGTAGAEPAVAATR